MVQEAERNRQDFICSGRRWERTGELVSNSLKNNNNKEKAGRQYCARYRKTVFRAIPLGASFSQRNRLRVERQDLCWEWICGFTNARQPRRQQVSHKGGGVFLSKPAVSQRTLSFQSATTCAGSNHLAGSRWTGLDLALSVEEAMDQERPQGLEGRARLLHFSGLRKQHN